jgi:hypothetical protein
MSGMVVSERAAEAFRRQAPSFEGRSPLYAELARRLAEEPLALSLGYDRWDLPLRLLGAARYVALAGEGAPFDDWQSFRDLLVRHRERLAELVRTQAVQTNEVQRCFGLLPCFLSVARRSGLPLDLLELGPSAGLNLLWDRYRYEYAGGSFGDAESPLVLRGEERRAVPPNLLRTHVEIVRRRGIDLCPPDVTTERGALLLEAFVWPGLDERVERLRAAIEIVRREPPELVRGDYVELLPALLAERRNDALTVVFQTASTAYLPHERLRRLLAVLEEAGRAGPLAWLSTRTYREHGRRTDHYPVELRVWPGEARVVERLDYHGAWLEWLG